MGEYSELHRPQFHFTAADNWINDPNGLVYQDGVWHLFFQHNIEAPVWGRMWWGHAVSSDLVHWEQIDHALYPDEMGTMFSGSAVIDHNDAAGFGEGAMLLFYTAAGSQAVPKRPFTQCLAVSSDNGKTFTKFDGNPVVDWIEADNRDPKVIWHEASQRWVMALFLDEHRYCLLNSPNAIEWTRIQNLAIDGDRECPDFFPLNDESGTERWIFHGANGIYTVGRFDGQEFVAETAPQKFDLGRNSYASQTWSNTPDGRCVQISWMAGGKYPEMPFNQQLSIPVVVSLSGKGDDLTLVRYPIEELESLRRKTIRVDKQTISQGSPLIPETDARLLDIEFTVHRQDAKSLYVVVRGHPILFNWDSNELTIEASGWNKNFGGSEHVQLPNEPTLQVRLLVDATSVEVFINGGQISASFCFLPGGYVDTLTLNSYSGDQVIEDFALHELDSAWKTGSPS
ncbi:MAG: glycoside hydrolase family 32 protein [Woeseiaceae bacterium]